MVVFTCNHCGDSLQKPRVEKHYMTVCRKPKDLTCVDCLKDFRSEEFSVHTSCVTEEQRYSAKGTLPKALKGQQKQENWTDFVKDCYDNVPECKEPKVAAIFKAILGQSNIPRKKDKFVNFIMSSSGGRTDKNTATRAFDLVQTYYQKEKAPTESKENSENEKNNEETPVIEEDKSDATEVKSTNKKSKKRKNQDIAEVPEVEKPNEKNKKGKQNGNIAENDTAENNKNKRKVDATCEEVDIKKMKLDEGENVAIADKPKGKKNRNKRKKNNLVVQNGNTDEKTETEDAVVNGGSATDEDKTDDSTKNSTETIVENGEAPKKKRKNRGKKNRSKVQENGGSPKKSKDNVSKDADKSEVKQDSAENEFDVKVSTKRMKKRLKAGKKLDKKSGGSVEKTDEAINTEKKKSKKSKADKKKALNSEAIAT